MPHISLIIVNHSYFQQSPTINPDGWAWLPKIRCIKQWCYHSYHNGSLTDRTPLSFYKYVINCNKWLYIIHNLTSFAVICCYWMAYKTDRTPHFSTPGSTSPASWVKSKASMIPQGAVGQKVGFARVFSLQKVPLSVSFLGKYQTASSNLIFIIRFKDSFPSSRLW